MVVGWREINPCKCGHGQFEHHHKFSIPRSCAKCKCKKYKELAK